MPFPAIQVENIGKRYRLGETHVRSLGDLVSSTAARIFGHRNGHVSPSKPPIDASSQLDEEGYFWALKGISFEVQPGEVVGIIGRNGAGKSTLLKILSKIVAPTTGRIAIRGRVASLLEVGTGFHPELTGRENVFLNSAILGMTNAEVRRKFDEIVAFAEISQFIDTPVKRYSSGMYVRLAFAVAAHLDPEILIVDEVLAVGDIEFQKKCLSKIQGISGQGRTVLFVSHNMAAVRQLCMRAVLLESGRVSRIAAVAEVVNQYVSVDTTGAALHTQWELADAPGNEAVRLVEIDIAPQFGKLLDVESGCRIRWIFDVLQETLNLGTTIEIRNIDDVIVLHEGTPVTDVRTGVIGRYSVEATIPGNFLNCGTYTVTLIFGENRKYLLLRLDNITAFGVELNGSDGRFTPTPALVRTNMQFVARHI